MLYDCVSTNCIIVSGAVDGILVTLGRCLFTSYINIPFNKGNFAPVSHVSLELLIPKKQ